MQFPHLNGPWYARIRFTLGSCGSSGSFGGVGIRLESKRLTFTSHHDLLSSLSISSNIPTSHSYTASPIPGFLLSLFLATHTCFTFIIVNHFATSSAVSLKPSDADHPIYRHGCCAIRHKTRTKFDPPVLIPKTRVASVWYTLCLYSSLYFPATAKPYSCSHPASPSSVTYSRPSF